jgi:hypothetical protein
MRATCIALHLPDFIIRIITGEVEVIPGPNSFSTMPWRRRREWRYKFTILSLDISWNWVVSFTPSSALPRENSPRYTLYKRRVRTLWRTEISTAFAENRTPTPRPSRSWHSHSNDWAIQAPDYEYMMKSTNYALYWAHFLQSYVMSSNNKWKIKKLWFHAAQPEQETVLLTS